MITTERTTSENSKFVELVQLLDAYLAEIDGEDHSYYSQFNKINVLSHCVIILEDEMPCGCGAIKQFDSDSMEVKRMFTLPESRGKGIATKVLTELENWAKEMGYIKCVLETGKRQPEAVALYTKLGYRRIPNYGQYKGMDNSLCFEKRL